MNTSSTSMQLNSNAPERMLSAARLALVSAQIAGDLFRSSLLAKELLLVAQNSRVLASRVQSEAPGLHVLSSFFAEISSDTIQLAGNVNHVANGIAGNSVAQWRLLRFNEAVHKAAVKAQWQTLPAGLQSKQQQAHAASLQLAQSYRKTIRGLRNNLQELDQQMQASQVLAVSFHLESTKAAALESSLRSMVSQLEDKSGRIAQSVQKALKRIGNLKDNRAINNAI